jgi:DNA-binding transcriptional LysR family regulator
MVPPMELRHLRYFVSVAEELNFTRAARKLRVAQPALSRQIRQLEEEVGVALFERDHRHVSLTPAGQAFLGEARAVLVQSEQAVRAAQHSGQPSPGVLNVGYVWGLFHSLVPRWVERFRRTSPDTAVNLFDLTPAQQVEALGQSRLDIAFIGFATDRVSKDLARQRVGSCAFVAALPEKHVLARRRVVELCSLAQEMFFAISDQTYPSAASLVAEACVAAGFRPRILQAAERGYTLLGLVAGNCGVALVPESLAALPHPGVVLRPLSRPPRSDLFLAWRPQRASAIRDAFLASLAQDTE